MFQTRLKELREKAGLSQAKLAKILGVGQSTVGMWENGTNKPENAKLEALANYFGVSTDYLLGRTDDPVSASASLREQMSDIQFALSGEIHDLTDDEMRDILDYVRFKRAQRRKDGK